MYKKIYWILLAILALAILCFVSGIKVVHHSKRANKEEIEQNVAYFTAKENGQQTAPIQSTSETVDAESGQETDIYIEGTQETEGAVADAGIDDYAERQKIQALRDVDPDYAQIRRWFDNAIICGDSLTEGAIPYGYLDSTVDYAVVGVSVPSGLDQFERAKMMAPEVLILAFGVNDIENYSCDEFINNYRAAIKDVKEALPNTRIYVNCLMPPIRGLEQELTFYLGLDEFNTRLKALCQELGVTYIDSAFVFEDNQDLYDQDGVHALPKFYQLWLTYLADVTGLSDE